MGEWMARVSFYAVVVDPAAPKPGVERPRRCDYARAVGVHARSAAVAPPIAGAAGLFAMLVAWDEAHNWSIFLQLLYRVPYGASDPLYDKDIAFYFFSLPAYVVIKNWMLITLFLSVLLAGAVYLVHGDIEFNAQRPSMSPRAIAHGSVLLGCFFAVKAWSYSLDRYLLLYRDNGVVVGASYTDIHVMLPVLWLLIGLAVIAALGCWANVRVRTYKLPVATLAILFGTSLVLGEMVPALIQRVYVKPNEPTATAW